MQHISPLSNPSFEFQSQVYRFPVEQLLPLPNVTERPVTVFFTKFHSLVEVAFMSRRKRRNWRRDCLRLQESDRFLVIQSRLQVISE